VVGGGGGVIRPRSPSQLVIEIKGYGRGGKIEEAAGARLRGPGRESGSGGATERSNLGVWCGCAEPTFNDVYPRKAWASNVA
jgi:hypothetical protein